MDTAQAIFPYDDSVLSLCSFNDSGNLVCSSCETIGTLLLLELNFLRVNQSRPPGLADLMLNPSLFEGTCQGPW